MANDEERQVLIKALFEAVRTSTDALQRVAGWARRGKAGAVLEAISFTAALFLHDDSRPSIHVDGSEFGDPNVHVHCIILNIAMRKDGTVGAIQSVLLRSAKMFAGAVFHAALAANLARLRLSSDRVGKNAAVEPMAEPAARPNVAHQPKPRPPNGRGRAKPQPRGDGAPAPSGRRLKSLPPTANSWLRQND